MVLDGLLGLYGLKYDSATACRLPLYLCSYKLDGSIIEVVDKAMPRAWHLGAPEPRWPGACLLAPVPWLASQARQEPRPKLKCVVDQEPEPWVSPKP